MSSHPPDPSTVRRRPIPDGRRPRGYAGADKPTIDPAVTAGIHAASGGASASSRSTGPATTPRLDYISWVRAIAATEVAVRHSDLITKHFSDSTVAVGSYYQFGAIGVEIFFVLSGYIMCMRAASYRNGAQYLLARLVRLVPMYWLFTSAVIVAYFVNSDWRLGSFDLSVFALLRSYLMLPAWGFPILSVGWTLEYEMIFYVAVALLAIGKGVGSGKIALLGVVIALSVGGIVMPGAEAGEVGPLATSVGHALSPFMLTFGLGWLIRLVEESGGVRPNWRLIIAVAVIFLLAMSQGTPDGVHLGFRAALAVCCFLLFQLGQRGFHTDGPLNRFMCIIGESSYSLYLSHWFIMSIFGKLLGSLHPPAVAAAPLRVVGIALCLAIGVAAYLLLERPIDRFLRVRFLASRRAATSNGSLSSRGV